MFRHYNSDLVDLVLVAATNCLRLTINVFEEEEEEKYVLYNMKELVPSRTTSIHTINVLQCGDHYNSIKISTFCYFSLLLSTTCCLCLLLETLDSFTTLLCRGSARKRSYEIGSTKQKYKLISSDVLCESLFAYRATYVECFFSL